jgi:hypothetical protein
MSRPALFAAVASVFLATAVAARAQEGNARAAELAKRCAAAHESMAFLRAAADRLDRREAAIRSAVRDLLANPAPTFMVRFDTPARRAEVRDRLVAEKLLDPTLGVDALFPPLEDPHRAPQPFAVAPGGTPGSHHAYPGGLAQHTAFNTRAALDLEQNYIARYGLKPWRDYNPVHVVAAPILHDIMKLWVFQWTADGSQIPQGKIGAPTTRSHSWTP